MTSAFIVQPMSAWWSTTCELIVCWTERTHHLVHGVVGVVALGMSAADPGGFQQLFLLLLLVGPLPLALPLSLTVPEGLVRVSTPERRVASLPARSRKEALRPPLLLLLPAASLPVSACRATTHHKIKKIRKVMQVPNSSFDLIPKEQQRNICSCRVVMARGQSRN